MQQQAKFDDFIHESTSERLHEALGRLAMCHQVLEIAAYVCGTREVRATGGALPDH
jgi:hypothetical protein